MKRPTLLLFAACATLTWHQDTVAQAAAADAPVLMQDLDTGGNIQWTRRGDNYTLQVHIFSPGGPPPQGGRKAVQAADDKVQVWLLKADGTIVPPLRATMADLARGHGIGALEYTYSFALSAGHEAVAAAIRVGNNYQVRKLGPFADEKG